MRIVCVVAVALLFAGCGQPARHAATPSAEVSAHRIDPGGIRRIRRDLPPGYEVSPLAENATFQRLWGLGGSSVANPERCAPLADPAHGQGRRAQGLSGSGVGGTIYAGVVAVPDGPVSLDDALAEQCRQWGITDGRTSAAIHSIEPPHIDGVHTAGMTAKIASSVEGGSEIASQATTFTAYLGGYYAFTTLISDPGSPKPPLPPQFAADLLVKTVSAVRG